MINKKSFFKNAAFLSATSMVMQTIGVSFNVYVSNKIGASALGLYSLIMSVYVFGVTLANSGIGLSATKIVSEEIATGNYHKKRKAAFLCIMHGLFFGSLAFLIMFFGSNFIANCLLGDSRAEVSLKILSLSLPFVGMSAAIGGYFIAVRKIVKNAATQFFEQLVRIAAVVFFLNTLKNENLALSCAAIVAGGTLAEICSFLFAFLLYKTKKSIKERKLKKDTSPLLSRILGVSLPVALSSYVRSTLRCLEHILIPKGLKKYGASLDASLALYGVVHGMVMPVLLFPSSFLSAFSTLLIPEITECQKLEKNAQIKRIMIKVYTATFIFSIGACGIFWVFSRELGMAIYNNPHASIYIKLLAPLTIAMYIDNVTDAILKGIGEQVYSMRVNIFDSAICVILTLVLIPRFGIGGYIAILFISELLNVLLSLLKLIKIADFKINLTEWVLKPAISIFCATIPVRLISNFYSDTPVKITVEIISSIILYLTFTAISASKYKNGDKTISSLYRRTL